MRFVSTRGGGPVSFTEAVLSGFASDGGMFLPETYPQLKEHSQTIHSDLCFKPMLSAFLQLFCSSDIPIDSIVSKSCIRLFGDKEPSVKLIPLRCDGSFTMLDLSKGPSGAFKDFGMTVLFEILDHLMSCQGKRASIVIDTTGDTGPSAIECAYGRANLELFVLYPSDAVAVMQEKQMKTCRKGYGLEWRNIHVLAVDECSCDDLDHILYHVFGDKAFSEEFQVVSVNSVSIVRILVQSFLFVWISMKTPSQTPVTVFIPTGASGNLAAAVLAIKCGANIRIVCACNRNGPLETLVHEGRMRKRSSKAEKTFSNAVDVQNPYNVWRVLHLVLAEGSSGTVKKWQDDFEDGKEIVLSLEQLKDLQSTVSTVVVSEQQTLDAIRECYRENSVVICPHTALAFHVALHSDDSNKCILVTAHPAKFREAVDAALGPQFEMEIPPSLSNRSDSVHAGFIRVQYGKAEDLLRTMISSIYNRRMRETGYTPDSLLSKWEIASILCQHTVFSNCSSSQVYDRIYSFKRTMAGYSALNYTIACVDGGKYFLKVGVPGSSIHHSIDEHYMKLKCIQKYVYSIDGFPTCDVIEGISEIPRTFDGRPCLLMSLVDGTNPETASDAFIQEIGRLLAVLHKQEPPEQIRRLLLPDFYFSYDRMRESCRKWTASVHEEFYNALAVELDSLDHLFTTGGILNSGLKRFCHGDVFLNNIIVNSTGLVNGIVDFEEACYCHPILEVAFAFCGCCTQTPMELDLRLCKLMLDRYVTTAGTITMEDRRSIVQVMLYATLGACEWRYAQMNIRHFDKERSSKWKELMGLYHWIKANADEISEIFQNE